MSLGKLVETGECDEMFENPRHPYTHSIVPVSLQVGGGAEGIRTPDLHVANVALSQLSYGPE
jgi:ABC-type dipeptide/oligopeptide/nickel transport system ATPase component